MSRWLLNYLQEWSLHSHLGQLVPVLVSLTGKQYFLLFGQSLLSWHICWVCGPLSTFFPRITNNFLMKELRMGFIKSVKIIYFWTTVQAWRNLCIPVEHFNILDELPSSFRILILQHSEDRYKISSFWFSTVCYKYSLFYLVDYCLSLLILLNLSFRIMN